MSGSDDGQLSPNNEELILSPGEDEGDTDSLDIKPPQAIQRDINRKHKSSKDKKHSRDKHKDRERLSDNQYKHDRRNNDRRHRNIDGSRREVLSSDHRHFHRGSNRNEYHHQRGDYQRNNKEFQPQRNVEYHVDYQRHKQRQPPGIDRIAVDKHYHHQQQQQQQQQQRLVDPTRDREISTSSSGSKKYIENDHSMDDAEKALEDLRSRLLSKRHKYYEKERELATRLEQQQKQQLEYEKSKERSGSTSQQHQIYEYRESNEQRKHSRRNSLDNVIELIDSPERYEKRKEHKKTQQIVNKIEDPELIARRAKFLEAEREAARRKEELEMRREELEARRELKRLKDEAEVIMESDDIEEGEQSNVEEIEIDEIEEKKRSKKKKRNHNNEDYKEHRKKRIKKDFSPEEGEYEDENRDDSAPESEVSLSSDEAEKDYYKRSDDSRDSGSENRRHRKSRKKRRKNKKRKHSEEVEDDNMYDEELPVSPFSIGDLSKSPLENTRRNLQSSRSRSQSYDGSERESRSKSHEDSADDESDSNDSRSEESRSISRSRSSTSDDDSEIELKRESQSDSDVKMKDQPVEILITTDKIDGDKSPCNDKGEKLPNYYPGVQGCRSVEEFQCLNRIEEGTYGVVYRAKDKRTNEIVALKRLKMEKEKEGFPITSLREINTLLKGQHPNIVTVREIVVGSNMDKIFIVMDYVEHDLKSLMETMKNKKQSFFPAEVKCLTQQLLRAVGHLHDNWILHRDLKTSNLLLSHKGILKVGDFGLAREYGSPLKQYTSLVVTLWYRAPELLLGCKEYSTPIDIWSVGCIFGEFLQMSALFPGKSEIDELNRIFKELGTPNERIWPGYKDLPTVQSLQSSHFTDYPVSNLRQRFGSKTTEIGIQLMQGLLTYDPKQRLTADQALNHPYFKELPLPIDPSMFPTWPAKSELGSRKALASSPKPPSGGSQFKQLGRDEIVSSLNAAKAKAAAAAAKSGFILNSVIEQRQVAMGPGFNLKF